MLCFCLCFCWREELLLTFCLFVYVYVSVSVSVSVCAYRCGGVGAVMQLGDHASTANGIEVISTGSLTLDKALGIGGLPKG